MHWEWFQLPRRYQLALWSWKEITLNMFSCVVSFLMTKYMPVLNLYTEADSKACSWPCVQITPETLPPGSKIPSHLCPDALRRYGISVSQMFAPLSCKALRCQGRMPEAMLFREDWGKDLRGSPCPVLRRKWQWSMKAISIPGSISLFSSATREAVGTRGKNIENMGFRIRWVAREKDCRNAVKSFTGYQN